MKLQLGLMNLVNVLYMFRQELVVEVYSHLRLSVQYLPKNSRSFLIEVS